MRDFRSAGPAALVTVICALFTLLPAAAYAAKMNVAVVRATVISNEPNCIYCGQNQGCFVQLSPPGEPIWVEIAGNMLSDCSTLVQDDCVEVVGETIDAFVAGSFTPDRIQLAATTWLELDPALCE